MSRGGTPGRGGGSQYGSDWSLAMSPPPTEEARETIVRPKSLVEKARMNVAWLDSSLSVMEQGVTEFDTILLRYKAMFKNINVVYITKSTRKKGIVWHRRQYCH